MSESETIWRATDADGRCWLYGEKPDWSECQFYSQDGRVLEYYGTEKPPPGECWEIVQMRKGDIDTDGDPIGWKIVGIGKDGSVLCEKGNGQRRRYSFERKGEQPSGEVCERLTKERDEALRELADERSRSGQVTTAQINVIAELQEQIRKLKVESATQTDAISEREDRIDQLSGEVQRLTARLAAPEMPECVAKLLQTFQPVGQSLINAVQTVRDHYAPPFRIDKPGVYETEDGNPWEVIYIDPKGGVVARHETTKLLENFHMSGACKGGNFSLTKYLRPLDE